MEIISILSLLNMETGEITELKRFDHRVEAPFFRGENELFFNAGGHIFRLWLNSGITEEIPTGYCTNCNNDHVLSPDGSQLAVSHGTAEDGISRIYLIDLIGGRPPRLITPLGPSYLHGWSPDGKTLAYCAERNGEYDVYTIPAEGGVEQRLTFSPGLNDGPEYAPDGRYIYFNSVRGGRMDCYRMDPDGRNAVRLTDNGRNNWFPHVSPDGRVIAYISYNADEVEPGAHPADKHVELRRVSPDGSDDRPVLQLFGGQGTLNVNSWMPNSRHLAFVRYEPAY